MMYRFLIPKPRAASSVSSDAAASTSAEAPENVRPVPSTSTAAPMQLPPPAPSASPDGGVSDLNGDAPSQTILASYLKRAYGPVSRSFNPSWYRTRPWLPEYIVGLIS